MPTNDEPRVYEIRAGGWADDEEIYPWHEPVTRLLCPDLLHPGPCEVPWSVQHDDEEHSTVLVVGIFATWDKATEIAERVAAFLGEQHPVAIREGDPTMFEELIEQYQYEQNQT